MHILVNGWFWGNNTSGSGQYLHYLTDHIERLLSAEADRLTLVVPTTEHPVDATVLPANVHLESKALLPLPRQLAKVWWEQVTIPLMAQRMAADVLWVPYWAAPYWQPVPTVATIHDIIGLLLSPYQGGRLQKIYTSLVSSTARRSTAIITVSQSSRRDIIQNLTIDETDVHAILSGVNRFVAANHSQGVGQIGGQGDIAEPSNLLSEDELRHKYGLPSRYFLYLGGFDVRKNVRAVIRGYQRYLEQQGNPEIHLVIAGKLPDEDTEFFPAPARLVERLGLSAQVHFCGFVEEIDKEMLYKLAVGYFFPSTYEGFGMTVLEAMDAGVPTVTSK